MIAPSHIHLLETRLQDRAKNRSAMISAAGCFDHFGARMALDAGYDALVVGGSALALSRYGRPVAQLLSPEAITEALYMVRDAGEMPLIADAADGFGTALHVAATVRAFEFAGASIVQISDRPLRRRDRSEGPRFAVAEMIGKLKAALDARRYCLIGAVVEIEPEHSPTSIIDRAAAYIEAGADLIIMRSEAAPLNLSQYGEGSYLPAPIGFEWGQRLEPEAENALAAKWYNLALYPFLLPQLLHGARHTLRHPRTMK